MGFVKGNAIRHCLTCGKQLTKLQEKFCRNRCCAEYRAKDRRIPLEQQNIIEALRDTGGIRWMPDSEALQTMISEYIPLAKVIDSRPVGIGRLTDYQLRLTRAGLRWIETHFQGSQK